LSILIVAENSCSCGTRFGAQVGLTAEVRSRFPLELWNEGGAGFQEPNNSQITQSLNH
jgi:hypothetical protein